MTDKEFNKLLDDDSLSDSDVRQRQRKRKARDMVRPFIAVSWVIISCILQQFQDLKPQLFVENAGFMFRPLLGDGLEAVCLRVVRLCVFMCECCLS